MRRARRAIPSWIKNGGEAVNGTNCGIGGIGINGNASEDLKRAAYIFAIWSVSQDNQFNVLKGLGGTPTRKSVLAMPEVQKAEQRPTTMPNALTFDAVYDFGIKDPNFVLGPKIPNANEYHSILAAEVQKCLSNEQIAGRGLQVDPDAARRAERRRLSQPHTANRRPIRPPVHDAMPFAGEAMSSSSTTIAGSMPRRRPAAAPSCSASVRSRTASNRGLSRTSRPSRLRSIPLPRRRYYFWLMAPAILVLAFISIYPFFWMIYMSLHDVDIGKVEWNNFENFTKLVSDTRFLMGWWLLIQYSVMCLTLQIVIGVFLAVSLNGSRFEKILVTTLLMPMMMAPAGGRHGLVLPLQRHLRLVSLAVAEPRHPRRRSRSSPAPAPR